MSITKSYNKHTNTYYAYDTTYVWDEKLQKKVQKKVCIGKYDPETGAIVPNAKRGRPAKKVEVTHSHTSFEQSVTDNINVSAILRDDVNEMLSQICAINNSITEITLKLHSLEETLSSLRNRIP